MSNDEEIFLGKQAETIITNPAYQAALARVKARIYEQWQDTGFFQSKERKDLWRMARVVQDFENQMQAMIDHGHLAESK